MNRHTFRIVWPPARLALVPLLLLAAAAHAGHGQGSKQAQLAPIAMEPVPALQRAKTVGRPNPNQRLDLCISFPFGRPREAQAFVDAVSSPLSPSYGRFISPEEVGTRFGLPQADLEAAADYLRANGMKVTLIGRNRLSILATCTVSQAEKAFGTTLRLYRISPIDEVEPDTFYAPSAPIRFPANLAPKILDVSGLENYTRPKPRTTLLNPFLTRALYNTAPIFNAPMRGEGRSIAISNWDGYRAANWLGYISTFGLPVPAGGAGSNIHIVTVGTGAGPGTPQGEGDLDIQMELGMAPLADIYIYDNNSSLTSVLTREANDNIADIISESWGWNIGSSTATAAHNLHVSMSAQGITYMAASGDNGTTLEPYSYPDYEPEVLSVGGTIANVDSSTGARISETGWSGSGGGWSTKAVSFNVRPSWQTGTGVPTVNATNNYRLVPDVGLHASGGTNGAFYVYFNGGLQTGWVGTSFSSPVFAGCLALAEQSFISYGGLPANAQGKRRFGRIQDLFYSQNGRPDVWFDIVSGGNGNLPTGQSSVCTAKWDTVTGWGAPNFTAFVSSLLNPVPSVTTISPTQALAGTAAFTLTVNGSSFINGSTVRWNGSNRTTTFVSSTKLTAEISAADISTAGSASVSVFTPTPGGGTSGSAAFTILPDVIVPPTSFTKFGDVISGSLSSLAALDTNRMRLQVSPVADILPPVRLSVEATSPLANPSRLDFILTSKAGISGRLIQVFLYDFASGSWTQVKSQVAPTTETTWTISVTSNPSRYIEAGTGRMRTRIDLDDLVSDTFLLWWNDFDQAVWRVFR